MWEKKFLQLVEIYITNFVLKLSFLVIALTFFDQEMNRTDNKRTTLRQRGREREREREREKTYTNQP